MPYLRGNFETETSSLIQEITGFTVDDENYSLCREFALSNFSFHRFLDVDSHKVTSAVRGLSDKFLIHSQEDKSRIFKELVEKFLSKPVFESSDSVKTDTHYALLSLLLILADAPTQVKYERPQTTPIPEESVEIFDWDAYLWEGEERCRGPWPESPPLSEDEEEREGRIPAVSTAQDSGIQESPDVTNQTAQLHWPLRDIISDDKCSESNKGYDWITKNVINQYWTGSQPDMASSSHHSSCNLYSDWKCYEKNTNPLYVTRPEVPMSETQIIREILWMLSGVKDVFVCTFSGDNFILRDNLVLSHLTTPSLLHTLQDYSQHAQSVQCLHAFVQRVITGSTCTFMSPNSDHHGNNKNLMVSQTYQAFAKQIAEFLTSFRMVLTGYEKELIKQANTFTLSTLISGLSHNLSQLAIIKSLYDDGIAACPENAQTSQKCVFLLNVLYQRMLLLSPISGIPDTDDRLEQLLLPIWLNSSRPYLDIVNEWLTDGTLSDPCQEFILHRSNSSPVLDETFWERAFDLHAANNLFLKDSGDELILSPAFLRPVLSEIVLAGKSMEMLQNLGRLRDLAESTVHQGGRRKTLYERFIGSLKSTLGVKPSDDTESNTSDKQHSMTIPALSSSHIPALHEQFTRQMRVKGTYDPLLVINFSSVFDPQRLETLNRQREQDDVKMNSFPSSVCVSNCAMSLHPLELLHEQCLYPHITSRYRTVCRKLVDILKSDYNLLQYLAAMRQYFLMETGDAMYDFYTELFNKALIHEPWKDDFVLNLMLQDVLRRYCPHDVSRLSITIQETITKGKVSYPINVFDCIHLQYKIPWPLDIIINSHCQAIYNEIFSFLLQIKYAKRLLDELRFSDLQKTDPLSDPSKQDLTPDFVSKQRMSRQQKGHRLQLLRVQLMNFVNSLHNYIMTRILHSSGLEFRAEMDTASDLDQIIQVHSAYIIRLHERCIQHKKVVFLKEAILKVLNLCLMFTVQWRQGCDEVSLKTLENMETEFSRYLQFLASFLNNVIKRGSFPHLEPLAYSLVSSVVQQRQA